MLRILTIAARVLAIVVLIAAAGAYWKREEIARLWAVNSLFEPDRIVANFSNMDRAFLNVEVDRGEGPVSPLPEGDAYELPGEVSDWIEQRDVTALVVLQDGALRHESYYLGTGPEDRRISWSVAKSFLSALMGTLVDDGTIADLDAPVTDFAPELAGSAYDGASIRDVLQMSSGVEFDEDYLDHNSDINRMGREIALGGTLDGFAAGLSQTFQAPGLSWQYVSIDTHVLGMVIRGATGRSVTDLLSERVVAPLGLEQSPYYLTDGEGVAFVLGGLNLRTRDYARLGQMFLQNGEYGGAQVVSADWVTESTAASANTEAGEMGYGYQWWIPVGAEPGEFMAHGIYGQYIYIDQARGVVIASNAADRRFREAGVDEENVAIFRLIARGL